MKTVRQCAGEIHKLVELLVEAAEVAHGNNGTSLSNERLDELAREYLTPGPASMINHRGYARRVLAEALDPARDVEARAVRMKP